MLILDIKKIYDDTTKIFQELIKPNNKFRDLNICLIACSISKVEGKKTDTIGNKKIAESICDSLWENKPASMSLAIQCCEHLNKAVIIEKNLAEKLNLEEVRVIPTDKAGGTFAATAYYYFNEPIIVENIKCDGGLDIGLNIIGMHLKDVAQPLVTTLEYIGKARALAARTRLKLIGGERSIYKR